MNRIIKLLTLTIVAVMGLSAITFGAKKMTANAEPSATETTEISPRLSRYILSPTLVAQNGDLTIVYDSEIQCLKAIENQTIVLASHQIQEPVAIKFISDHLFILTSSALLCQKYTPKTETTEATLTDVPIVTIDSNQPTTTSYAFSGTFSCFCSLEVSETTHSVFVQVSSSNNNIEIYEYKLTYFAENEVFGLERGYTYHSATISESVPESKITSLAVQSVESGLHFVCSNETATYGLNCSSTELLSCEELSAQPAKAICSFGDLFACAMQEEIMFLNKNYEQQAHTIAFAAQSLCESGSKLVATSATTQTITFFLPEQLPNAQANVLFENQQIIPSINANIQFGSTQVPDLTLYQQPYSVGGIPLEMNQSVIILSQNGEGYEGYSYVTFATNGTNHYGYLYTSQITIKQPTTSNYAAKLTVDGNLFLLPSNVVDQSNTIVAQLAKNQQITIISNAANIINNATKFVQAQTENGEIGYVELAKISQVVSVSSIKQNQTNATIKRETYLYQSNDGTNQLLSISKGTRIKIFGLLNPKSKYTRVEFETQDGTTYSGYILSQDITPDSITTLQLTGIVLLVANTALIVLIISFVIVAKKRKQ